VVAGQLLARVPVGPISAGGLALGFGAVTHILWERLEYVTFIRGNPNELSGAYIDTLGDMALSLFGSALAALVIATRLRRREPLEA